MIYLFNYKKLIDAEFHNGEVNESVFKGNSVNLQITTHLIIVRYVCCIHSKFIMTWGYYGNISL